MDLLWIFSMWLDNPKFDDKFFLHWWQMKRFLALVELFFFGFFSFAGLLITSWQYLIVSRIFGCKWIWLMKCSLFSAVRISRLCSELRARPFKVTARWTSCKQSIHIRNTLLKLANRFCIKKREKLSVEVQQINNTTKISQRSHYRSYSDFSSFFYLDTAHGFKDFRL